MLRVLLGEGLEALAHAGGCGELGFATVEAHALERCGRSPRWVQESRALARRLGELPELRAALVSGEVSFSMAQVIAKVASASDEKWWIEEARARTVRAMRELVKERARGASEPSVMVDESRATLTVTVDREDVWLFECARMLGKHLGEATLEGTLEALLAEGATMLLGKMEREAIVPFEESVDEDHAQRAWERELSSFRDEAEVLCEARFVRREDVERERFEVDWSGGAEEVDSKLRRIAAELARRDLLLGEQAERFWMADGWRRLGYATESQYARERLASLHEPGVFTARRDAAPSTLPLGGWRRLRRERGESVCVVSPGGGTRGEAHRRTARFHDGMAHRATAAHDREGAVADRRSGAVCVTGCRLARFQRLSRADLPLSQHPLSRRGLLDGDAAGRTGSYASMRVIRCLRRVGGRCLVDGQGLERDDGRRVGFRRGDRRQVCNRGGVRCFGTV